MITDFENLSEVGGIQEICLRHVQDAFGSQELLEKEWQALRYSSCPHYEKALKEYEALLKIFSDHKIKVHFYPSDPSLTIDSIYVRDASIVTPYGVVLCAMGKPARACEPAVAKKFYHAHNIHVLGEIVGSGKIEGGDLVWLDRTHVAVAHSYRTNLEGIRQLQELLGKSVEIIVVPLPHYQGSGDVFHLMSILSPIDHDLLLVYSPLMPIVFREWLLAKGYHLVEVPEDEFLSMGCNVLAIAPRKALMIEGNPKTKHALEACGTEVITIKGEEICHKGQGGPTCLTRPLFRA
ncbi:MAG: hypothetical protein HQK50_07850 [Oligoflexia bacterium]|nr:hypothetical protein [Oligoflexia bacterium]MBF0365470.1 hypothetical protein [Oligoflexia bacterium]